MSPSRVEMCPCGAHQAGERGMERDSVRFLHGVPFRPQAGSLELSLSLPQSFYSTRHIGLPHRGVVRMNKCWYSALEM